MAPDNDNNDDNNIFIGTTGDDTISGGDETSKINGNSGSDAITSGDGNDLGAGDMVGSEWSFANGKWIYDPSAIDSNGDKNWAYNDTIDTGDGNDVLLGNGGHDLLFAGRGDDLINAGTGHDTAYGGEGDDIINLESGSDQASGGLGDDTINAGTGDDVVFGDQGIESVLAQLPPGFASAGIEEYGNSGTWKVSGDPGAMSMTQAVTTDVAETYVLSFELAANLATGSSSGTVEVIWNGEVIGTATATSGAYDTFQIEVPSGVDAAELTFREVPSQESGPTIHTDGAAFYYDKSVKIGGDEVEVAAFAPGQAKLYQVIDGQLKVFDPATETYEDAGDPTGFKINAIGYNVEDDLIYGIAKSTGVDALGTPISRSDLVMLDAQGNAYRVGDTPVQDYVGDFDDEGNLWTFQTSLNRVTMIDVDNLDENGDPVSISYDLPNDFMEGRAYDIAYNAEEGVFYAVEPPSKNGEPGAVHRIDLSELPNGGEPQITSVEISATLFEGEMVEGMAKGAYGAVFFDGDGNLYFGLNKGDHDLDGATGAQGAIYKVEVDWDDGTAYAEFMAEAQATGSNDGAVDPRSSDAFSATQTDATVLIRDITLTGTSGGNDDLRGGDGNDLMFGEAGADKLFGGQGDDTLSGGLDNDKILGGAGDDELSGGQGKDKLLGGGGDDTLSGDQGADYLHGGKGDDAMAGGEGDDKLVGGQGSDTISGGAGDDHMWGGNWSADQSADTFVVAAGGGKDMIHDFETDHDMIDLSAYGLEFADVQHLMSDKGWATEIDLSGLDGGQPGDKIIIKSVDPDELDETNFLL